MKQVNALNALTLGTLSGWPGFSTAEYFNDSSPTSRTDIYTVPAGKKAVLRAIGYYNHAGTARTLTLEVYLSGGYYMWFEAVSVPDTTTGSTGRNEVIVLEEGEKIAITANGTNLQTYLNVSEFDASVPVKSARLLSMSSGDNDFYTCPAGFKAYVPYSMFYGLSPGGQCLETMNAHYFNGSGGARSVYLKFQPNGGSAYATMAAETVADKAWSYLKQSVRSNLSAGDKIILNTNAATATQWANVLIIELPV